MNLSFGNDLLFAKRWGLSVAIAGGAGAIDSSLWMEVVFSWASVGGATSYTLQIGTTSGASDYGSYVVGNVLTYTLNLPPGTYYARVVDNFTSTASAEQGPFFV